MDLRSSSRRAASTECKCSQPQILNVKCCEQDKPLIENGLRGKSRMGIGKRPCVYEFCVNSRIVGNPKTDPVPANWLR